MCYNCAGEQPLVLRCTYAEFSSALSSEWTSSEAEMAVVDTVPFVAGKPLENASEVNGNIAVVSRGGDITFVDKAKRAAEAGAVGVIIINTEDALLAMPALDDDAGYKSKVPVLMIKSSDAARLREHHGSALVLDISPLGGDGLLSHIVQGVNNPDPSVHLDATTQFRKLLSIERNPPIQMVIDAGVVPRFVDFLQVAARRKK